MREEPFRREDHYVPCLYLRGFASASNEVFTYRTLVSHPKIPVWKPASVRGIAYLAHLYTRITAGSESDEIEKWLEREFESPAANSIARATSDDRLTRNDWDLLGRFAASQSLRTPAYYRKNFPRWCESAPRVLNEAIEEVVRVLRAAMESGVVPQLRRNPHGHYIPLRTDVEILPDKGTAAIKSRGIVGRDLWTFAMKHLLTTNLGVLQADRWTIVAPYGDLKWFTSDDPTILLNYDGESTFDFDGGWGRPGTRIMLPLGPRHLLYTRIGHSLPRRGTVMTEEETHAIRRVIAMHADQMIIARAPDSSIPLPRPRLEDEATYRAETALWSTWHSDQVKARQNLEQEVRAATKS